MIIREFTKAYNKVNEDIYRIETIDEREVLICVADGMGGLSLGDKCAACACEGIHRYVKSHVNENEVDWTRAFTYADSLIKDLSIECKSNMGTTLSSLILNQSMCSVAWQGNVRVYLLRDQHLEQINYDHVMNIGYGMKKISRCLKGGGLREDVPSVSFNTMKGDVIYICTDGFYELCEDLLGTTEDIRDKFNEFCFEDDATCIQIVLN